MNSIVKRSELVFAKNSVCDQIGRVFFYKDAVYREIAPEFENHIASLVNSQLFADLHEHHYIPKTKVSSILFEGMNYVLEHEKLLITQPCEWSFSQIKAATIFLLEFNQFLNKYGYCLKDGHFWNVSFCNNKPIFIDIGSIVPGSLPQFHNELIYTCLIPLILYVNGESYIAKALLSQPSTIYQRTIPSYSIQQSASVISNVKKFFRKINFKYAWYSFEELLSKANNVEFISKYIVCPHLQPTMWGQYQDDFFLAIDNNEVHERFGRFVKIQQFIMKYCADATSVVDIAGNQGGMLYYINKQTPNQFKQLINIDYDEIAIEQSIANLTQRTSHVHTYLMNFMLHSNHDLSEFRSDLALALAITHHLILSQGFHIDCIFDKISEFSKKYVFIEFMPWGLWGGGEMPPIPEWYTEEWFESEFTRKFTLLYKEDFGFNRMLFVGKLKV